MQQGQRRSRGATGSSYGLVVGLIAIVSVVAVTNAGSSVDTLMGQVAERMDEVNRGEVPASQSTATPTPTPTPTPVIHASCQAILTDNPSASSGQFTIDPDGAGPIPAFETLCDMDNDDGTGTGWTLYFASDAGFTGMTLRDSLSDWTVSGYGGTSGGFMTCGTFGRIIGTTGISGTQIYPNAGYVEIDLEEAHPGMTQVRVEANFGQYSTTTSSIVIDGTPTTFDETAEFDMHVLPASAGDSVAISERYIWANNNSVYTNCGAAAVIAMRSLWIR